MQVYFEKHIAPVLKKLEKYRLEEYRLYKLRMLLAIPLSLGLFAGGFAMDLMLGAEQPFLVALSLVVDSTLLFWADTPARRYKASIKNKFMAVICKFYHYCPKKVLNEGHIHV